MLMSSFLSLSHSLPEHVLTTARSSLWYNPTFFPNLYSNEFKMKSPTSLQIYTLSKLPIVMSKVLSLLHLDHVRFLWKRRDLCACLIILMSVFVISVNWLGHEIDRSRSCSVMEG